MMYFDEAKAQRAVDFFPTHLKHTDGRWAGKRFELSPWQIEHTRQLFGWRRDDGTRRYRTAYIEVPRKNGKSTWAAGVALYLFVCDGEFRPEVYCAATDRKQAGIVYEQARRFVEASPTLLREIDIRQYEQRGRRRGGILTTVVKDTKTRAPSQHGRSASGIIYDEVHAAYTRDIWDVLRTSTGARAQPLTFSISTAGHDRESLCWSLHQQAERFMGGDATVPDHFYGYIYGLPDDAEWRDPENWKVANPNYGVSLSEAYIREMFEEAISTPEAENTFRNLHLNQWTEQAVRWLPMHEWDACQRATTLEDFAGKPCFAALDLANTRDINALSLLFPNESSYGPRYTVFCFYWAPREAISQRAKQDRHQVANWLAKGLIRGTEGNSIDTRQIAADCNAILSRFDCRRMLYDPWGCAPAVAQTIDVPSQPCPQQLGRLAVATREIERLIFAHELTHDGDPVLRWMVSNASTTRPNANGDKRPDKGRSADKIDGLVATVMALAAAMAESTQSVYDTPGQLQL